MMLKPTYLQSPKKADIHLRVEGGRYVLIISYLFIYYTVYTHVRSFTIVKNRKCGQVTSHCRKVQPYRADLSLFLYVADVSVKSEITFWGRLFQTVGEAWEKARLEKFRTDALFLLRMDTNSGVVARGHFSYWKFFFKVQNLVLEMPHSVGIYGITFWAPISPVGNLHLYVGKLQLLLTLTF